MGSNLRTLVLATLVALSGSVVAKDLLPAPNGLVLDQAKMMSSGEAQRLNQKLINYDNETSTQIAVLTIVSIEDDDMFDYAQRLGEKWGIGTKEHDNGVLVLIAKEERDIWIHTGYGVEGALPDAMVKRIIENEIKPSFKADRYFEGLDKGTDAMIKALAGEYTAPAKQKRKAPFLIVPFLIALILITIFARRRRYTGYGHSGRRYYGSPWIGGIGGGSSGWGGGGSFGGGGGFGGFGGGGFGGGGAGGSW